MLTAFDYYWVEVVLRRHFQTKTKKKNLQVHVGGGAVCCVIQSSARSAEAGHHRLGHKRSQSRDSLVDGYQEKIMEENEMHFSTTVM